MISIKLRDRVSSTGSERQEVETRDGFHCHTRPLLPDRARPRGLSWLVLKVAREDARGPAEEVVQCR